MKQHFETSDLPKINTRLNRDTNSRQLLKVCFACNRGFCKRKGRGKYEVVDNTQGRYICQKCATDILAGKANGKVALI